MWFRRIFRLGDQPEVSGRRSVPAHRAANTTGLGALETRQLDKLHIRGSKALRGDRIGNRQSYRLKPSIEFKEYRSYVPGDDIRFVDWRATARHENIFIRQGELPKDVIVYLLLDCSASMNWGRVPKMETQLALASALSYSALTQGDRLVIYPYGGIKNVEFGPVSGKGNLPSVARYLRQLRYGGEGNLLQAIKRLTQKVSRGGVVFILSDLLESGDFSSVLSYVPPPRWWVNLLHLLHPNELAPEITGAYELEDSETGKRFNMDITSVALQEYRTRINKWMSDLEMLCVEQHAFYNLINTNWSLGEEIIPYLREHQVLVAQ